MDRPQAYSSSADGWKAAASISLAVAFLIIPVSTQVWITAASGAKADGELLVCVAVGALLCLLTRRLGNAAVSKSLFVLGLLASVWAAAYAYRGHQDMMVLKHAVDTFSGVVHEGAPTRVTEAAPLYVPGYHEEARQVAAALYDMADITYAGESKMKANSDQIGASAKKLDMKPEDIFFNPSIVQSNRGLTAQIDSLVNLQVGVFQEMMKNMQTSMAGANVPASMKKGFDVGYSSSASQMEEALKNLSAKELVLTTAFNSYMDFASQETGKVKMQNGKVLFSSRAELDEFNLRRTAIQSSAKDEMAAVSQVKGLANADMSSISSIRKMVGE